MTDVNQTLQGVGTSRVDSLKPKEKTRIACWNVRTLYQTGKLAQVLREFQNYRLDILGVCEARWTGRGQRTLISGHTILYSGRSDDQHTEGVALIMSRKMEKTLIEWKPAGSRLLKASFNSKYTNLTVIVCYAPTEDAEEADKDAFYDQLQAVTDEVPTHNLLMVLGDLNARPGSNNTGRDRVMGKYGIGTINDNGERLCHFCDENDMFIGGTLFEHKDIHKTTWTSPNGVTKSQIDHILINGRWRSSLQDVRACRGADVGSDHTLLVAVVSLKLRRARRGQKREQQFDISKLRDDQIRQAFRRELRNRFQILGEEQEMNIDSFNQAFKTAGEKVLGFKKKKKEEWIQWETWKKVETRKEIKQKMNSTQSERVRNQLRRKYSEVDREVKKMTKLDKRKYVERLAEEAAGKQDLKTLYKINKTLNNGFKNSDVPVKDADGNVISKEAEKLTRWKEHFESILNRPEPDHVAEIPPAVVDLDICIDPPSIEEVKAAIKAMKSGKAGGADGVTAEMLKAEETETPRILTDIFREVWESETTPEAWKTGLIVKLPKKGDLGECNNWRGITLLPITSKILSKIIHTRLAATLDEYIRQEQAGFRPGRSCSDHIFTLRQILEQSKEWNAPLYANFIDFEKAFDSIHRDSLWKILRHYGIPSKLVNIIKMLYSDFRSRVICNTVLTDAFRVTTGVKQGCILSPFLFILGIDWVLKQVTSDGRRGIRWTLTSVLEDLDYADDIALLAHRHQDMQAKTNALATTAGSLGLKINSKKTRHFRMNSRTNESIMVNGDVIDEVDHFTYLGSKVSTSGDGEEEIQVRISKASQAFAALRGTWRSKNISQKTKIRLFKSNVLSTLLYGAESWKMTKTISHKLEVFQNRCLRRILRIYWPQTISNYELRRRTGTVPITQQVQKKRWKWIGHVLRMPPAALPRVALRWTPDGRRKRGRPKETWRRTVERELRDNNWTWGHLERQAPDRHHWRSLVEALCVF